MKARGLLVMVMLTMVLMSSWDSAFADTCVVQVNGACVDGSEPSEPEPNGPPGGSGSSPERSEAPAEPTDSLERRMFDMMNSERAKAGLPPLAQQSWAHTTEKRHADRMSGAGQIWHNSEYMGQGRKAMGASRLGENVVTASSVEKAHRKFMDSAPHRANILDGQFTHAGIGISRDSQGMIYAAQGFARISQVPQQAPASKAAGAGPTTARGGTAAATQPVESAQASDSVAEAAVSRHMLRYEGDEFLGGAGPLAIGSGAVLSRQGESLSEMVQRRGIDSLPISLPGMLATVLGLGAVACAWFVRPLQPAR